MSNSETLIGLGKVKRALDLGKLNPAWEGQSFEVWVNPPSKYFAAFGKEETEEEAEQTATRYVQAVYDFDDAAMSHLDLGMIYVLDAAALELRKAYYDELSKNLKGGLTPGQTP